jgi:hypothetical protein
METLEEAAERLYPMVGNEYLWHVPLQRREGFIEGAKWQQERSYSEEEVLNLLTHFAVEIQRQNKCGQYPIQIKGWFERNKDKFKNK